VRPGTISTRLFVAVFLLFCATAQAQQRTLRIPHPGAPEKHWTNISADSQEVDGDLRHLRGHVVIEMTDATLKADEVDYNDDTGDADARGNVDYQDFTNGNKLKCDHAKYNTETEHGEFYEVSGTSPQKIQARPGLLTTSNPFYFEGEWAEKIEDRYIVHDGMITDCKVPKPWWTMRARKYDYIPLEHVIAYHAVFRIRFMPIFYAPVYYKSLKKLPRKSGFLAPNIGNSSVRGFMIGGGYYWAINPSYDLSYRGQYFSTRGFAHDFGIRGKVKPGTDFSATLYGVNDTGPPSVRASGFSLQANGRSDLGDGFYARASLDYLSSYRFRQTFTETLSEAVFSETHSVGFITKHWDTLGVNFVAQRDQDFLDPNDDKNNILIRKVPEVEFLSREHEVKDLPIWVSFDSAAGLLDREQLPTVPSDPTQPTPVVLQTPRFVDRIDVRPQATTAFHFAGFSLVPTFAIEETQWGASIENGKIVSKDFLRSARDLKVELIPPAFERIFKAPKWTGVDKIKHVFETRATYRRVDGVHDYNSIIRFDDLESLTDTNEVDLQIVNRLYVKRKDGNVDEVLTWQISQARYFDPTFGGAVVTGERNVFLSSSDLTGFAFIDRPRNYSPIVSQLHFQQKVGVTWEADYDPLFGHLSNSTISVDARYSKYFVSAGETMVNAAPDLTPPTNQFRALVGVGDSNRRGWSAAVSTFYDYRRDILTYATMQVTYNTDCCGLSVQYRRFNFGQRDESQFRVAFAISNIGTFGTLRRQERLF